MSGHETHFKSIPHPEWGAPHTKSVPDPVEGCEGCVLSVMMTEIHEAWYSRPELTKVIWSRQDGYGRPGYTPVQGYDWSGIRDSSPDAVRAMHRAIKEREASA